MELAQGSCVGGWPRRCIVPELVRRQDTLPTCPEFWEEYLRYSATRALFIEAYFAGYDIYCRFPDPRAGGRRGATC